MCYGIGIMALAYGNGLCNGTGIMACVLILASMLEVLTLQLSVLMAAMPVCVSMIIR